MDFRVPSWLQFSGSAFWLYGPPDCDNVYVRLHLYNFVGHDYDDSGRMVLRFEDAWMLGWNG